MSAYSPTSDIANLAANKHFVGDSVRIGAKRAASKTMWLAEDTLRTSLAVAGFTRNSGLLRGGLIDITGDYVAALNSAADASMQAQQDYETIQVGNIIGRMDNSVSIFARGQSSLIEQNERIAEEQLRINGGYQKAATSLQLDAIAKALEESHKVDLFNIREQSDVTLKTIEHNGAVTLKLAEIGWDIAAQEALLVEQNITKADVLQAQLARTIPRAALHLSAELTDSQNEFAARNTVAKEKAVAELAGEQLKNNAELAAIVTRSTADIAKMGVVNAARISALETTAAGEESNIVDRTDAKIVNITAMSGQRLIDLGNELKAETAANLIVLAGKVTADLIETKGRMNDALLLTDAHTDQLNMLTDAKVVNFNNIEAGQLANALATSNARVQNISDKSAASISDALAVAAARLDDQSRTYKNALVLQNNEYFDAIQNSTQVAAGEVSNLKLRNADANTNLTNELASDLANETALQNAQLTARTDILNTQLLALGNETDARTYASNLGVTTNATMADLRERSSNKQQSLMSLSNARITVAETMLQYWRDIGTRYTELNVLSDNQLQNTWYIKQ